MTKEEVLKNSKIEGLIVKLPEGNLDRKLYLEVSKTLELIGGKWKGGKIAGFVFQTDPTELLNEISTGEKRNLKKEFQFFATPDSIASYLVELAQIEENHTILEPSAGQGAIVQAINRVQNICVDCYELMPTNKIILEKVKNVRFIGDDFLETNDDPKYDRIIANPPFSKNQDIDHIKKMYSKLLPNGRLVSVSSKHWQLSNNKKETDFKNWLSNVDAEIIEIEKGAFKESGTMISSLIIVIDKK